MVDKKIPEKLWSLKFDELPKEIDALTFPNGDYIRDEKIKKSKYNDRLEALQVELVKLQRLVRA